MARELDDELQAALDVLIDEELREGKSPADARRSALLTLGGIETVKVQVRDARAGAWFDTVLGDIRYGATLVRNPIFTLTAALSLAIGIGATTTIFTVANGLLLRSAIGVTDPGRLVDITRSKDAGWPWNRSCISYPDYLEVRRRATTLDGVYVISTRASARQPPRREHWRRERVYPGVVTINYFEVLGVPAIVRANIRRRRQRGRRQQPGRRPQSSLLGASISVGSREWWDARCI